MWASDSASNTSTRAHWGWESPTKVIGDGKKVIRGRAKVFWTNKHTKHTEIHTSRSPFLWIKIHPVPKHLNIINKTEKFSAENTACCENQRASIFKCFSYNRQHYLLNNCLLSAAQHLLTRQVKPVLCTRLQWRRLPHPVSTMGGGVGKQRPPHSPLPGFESSYLHNHHTYVY